MLPEDPLLVPRGRAALISRRPKVLPISFLASFVLLALCLLAEPQTAGRRLWATATQPRRLRTPLAAPNRGVHLQVVNVVSQSNFDSTHVAVVSKDLEPSLIEAISHDQSRRSLSWPLLILPAIVATGVALLRRGGRPAIAAVVARNLDTPIAAVTPRQLAKVPPRIAIVGGGPCGLALALGLARRGWRNITVLDKRDPLPAPDDQAVFGDNARHYMIGISGRGQKALRRLGAMEALDRHAHLVRGRMDWNPGSGTAFRDGKVMDNAIQKGYTTRTIQRDRLAGLLREEVAKFPEQVTLRYNTELANVEWATEGPASTLTLGDGRQEHYDLVFGADGVGSVVRDALEREGELRVARYVDDNQRVYKTIPMHLPPDWRGDLNYSCRTQSGLNLDALPTAEGPYIGVLLFRPGCEMVGAARDVASARRMFDTYFPMFSPAIKDDDLAIFAAKEPSKLPVFRTVSPRLHRRSGGACLLGDCIHTVKPYFGLGVNSAFEDVTTFMDCLTATDEDPATAIELFSQTRAKDAEALVRMSHSFDRPGLGTFTSFLLPLILDNLFSKVFPSIFAPNPLRLLQDPNLTFSEVARRKRRDRWLQAAVLAVGLGAIAWGLSVGVARLLYTLRVFAKWWAV